MITKKHFAFWLLVIGLVFNPFGSDSDVLVANEKENRPNIILIMADDLGYETIACNGGTSYKTPRLDRLAKQGIRFQHCYSQPLCTPSRVQIMTGIYNVRNYEVFGVLPENEVTFANLLQDAGYKTCIVGKWQLKRDPFKTGFDEYCLWHFNDGRERYPNPGLRINGKDVNFKKGEYGPDVVCNFACDFIKKNKEKPFLIYYPMILTHCPFCPTPDSADWDPKDKGSPTYKGKAKYFGDMVLYMDKLVGRLVDTLEEQGIRDNTLIMFTGDNGTDSPVVSMMGDRQVKGEKGKMNDGGTHVPFIASWPKVIQAGQTSDHLVDFSDFFPTICNATHVTIPQKEKIDGQSFLWQLNGSKGTPREWIYCWYARNGGFKGQQWARNQQFKLYPDGKFIDVKNDPGEKAPKKRSQLNENELRVYEQLNAVLKRFESARPKAVAEIGQKRLDQQKKRRQEKKKKQQANQAANKKKKSPGKSKKND